MRTTIDLPEPLVTEAMKASPRKTKTAVIITALEEYVRKNRIQGLKRYRGKISLDIDLNKLRLLSNDKHFTILSAYTSLEMYRG
jgi:Arc/MetJ family transcription regulator